MSEAIEIILYQSVVRIPAVFLIIIIYIFKNVPVEFFLRPDQRFDPALEGKGQLRILIRHIFIELADSL